MKNIYIITILLQLFAYGYTFSPSTLSMSASGSNSSYIYTIHNESNKLVPIDISINEFSKDIDGNHIQGQIVYDDFIIYPAQFILNPGEKRSIQVRWVGIQSVDIEKNYTIHCKEVLLPEKEQELTGFNAVVKVKKNYMGRLYIKPTKGSPDIHLVSVSAPLNDVGEQMLELIVKNQGNIHGNLAPYSFEVQAIDETNGNILGSIVLNKEEIPKMASAIHAGAERRYLIPWPKDLPITDLKVNLNK